MLRLHGWALGISRNALTTPGGASHSPIPARPPSSVIRTITVSIRPLALQGRPSAGMATGNTSTWQILSMLPALSLVVPQSQTPPRHPMHPRGSRRGREEQTYVILQNVDCQQSDA